MFSKMKGSTDVVETQIAGVALKVLPNVFSPEVFFESKWFAEKVAVIAAGKKLLEIGPGTGIIGLFAALKGAQVTALDINETAVENTKLNFSRHKLVVDVRLGSVYEPLGASDAFDIIFWNHPFNKTSQQDTDPFFKSVFDYQYTHLETYVSQGGKHLLPGGRLLLGTSSIASLADIELIAEKYDYDFVLVDRIDIQTEVDATPVDLRIYEFKARKEGIIL